MIETELDTTDFEVMPDGTIKLYSYFNDINDIQKVSMAITKNRLIIEQFSQMGDDLEGYFTKLVAGVNND